MATHLLPLKSYLVKEMEYCYSLNKVCSERHQKKFQKRVHLFGIQSQTLKGNSSRYSLESGILIGCIAMESWEEVKVFRGRYKNHFKRHLHSCLSWLQGFPSVSLM